MEPPGPDCEMCYEAVLMPSARKKTWNEQFDVDNEEEIIQIVALNLAAFQPSPVSSANTDVRVH